MKTKEKKNPVGRPTKYNEDLQTAVDKWINEVENSNEIFYLEHLAQEISVDTETINNWQKKHKKFFGSIKRLLADQKKKLMDHGLYEKVGTTMAIFLLKCNHGMVETSRQITEHTAGEGKSAEIKVVIEDKPE